MLRVNDVKSRPAALVFLTQTGSETQAVFIPRKAYKRGLWNFQRKINGLPSRGPCMSALFSPLGGGHAFTCTQGIATGVPLPELQWARLFYRFRIREERVVSIDP